MQSDSGTDWKDHLLADEPRLRDVNGIAAISEFVPEPESAYWDIDYESILADPYRTVTAEYPFYMDAIARAYDLISDRPAHAVADLGCGDGRFTRKFLELGCPRVVSLDISLPNLHRLRRRIDATPGAAERVLLVEGDIADPPLPLSYFDLVLAAGVLCVLRDREQYVRGVRACRDRVRPGGYMLVFDPIDFGSIMYAIVRQDLQELRTVLAEGTKSVDIADPAAYRVAVRGVAEMVAAHEEAGLEVLAVTGIPLFPSLLFGGVKQLARPDAENLELMRSLNDALVARFPDCWRAACLLSRRSG